MLRQTNFPGDDHYILMEEKDDIQVEAAEEKKPIRYNSALPIPNAVITNVVLPFLSANDRANLSSTARALRYIDPQIQRIHLLQQWDPQIEEEAKKLDWSKFLKSSTSFWTMFNTLALSGTSVACCFFIKFAVESPNNCDDGADGRCAWNFFGSLFGAATGIISVTLGAILKKNINSLREVYRDPRTHQVSKDLSFVNSLPTKTKECVTEFKKEFPNLQFDLNLDLNQTTLTDFRKIIKTEKTKIRMFMDHVALVPESVALEIKSEASCCP